LKIEGTETKPTKVFSSEFEFQNRVLGVGYKMISCVYWLQRQIITSETTFNYCQLPLLYSFAFVNQNYDSQYDFMKESNFIAIQCLLGF